MNPTERKAEVDRLWKEQQAARRAYDSCIERVRKLNDANTWSRNAEDDVALARQRFDTAKDEWQAEMVKLARGE